mgnify:CR=1 FL=1
MQDPLLRFQTLRRPRLLLEAARAGVCHYIRETHLSRVLGGAKQREAARPLLALEALLELEHSLDAARRQNEASYSYFRHVEVLIAAIAEADLLRTSHAATPAE